jgi:hypothetical protein
MILAALLALAEQLVAKDDWFGRLMTPVEEQTSGNPFDQLIPKSVELGSGPHTLVISDGSAVTRMDYKTGATCQKARDAVRLQTDSRIANSHPGIIYGPPRVQAFCVPR